MPLSNPDLKGPLTDIRVLDFSRVVAGPYATRLLSDLGADVLKVEPPEGDLTRLLGLQGDGESGYYLQQNIGKRNICIDLKVDGARELILKLAAKADMVVENFRPGIMDKFGVGWKDLSAVNGKLVMLSISGFGQNGPERGRAAYAPIIHAEAGVIARQAEMSGGPAMDLQVSIADTYSSLHGVIGLLAALRVAEQTGIGQHIDVAMIDALHSADDYAHWALDEAWPKPPENLVWDAPEDSRILISGDLKWLWHLLSTHENVVAPVSEGADLKTKIAARGQAVADWVKTRASFDALTDRLDELNLAWGRLRAFGADSFEQTSVVANGVIVDIEDSTGASRRTVQSPYRFSRSQSGISPGARAPRRGGHNFEALEDWLGESHEAVAAYRAAGILCAE
jgi:crotonobetainyl-CoA:carnitine CoA-transferase CaiB-like acyl-CoA transferase